MNGNHNFNLKSETNVNIIYLHTLHTLYMYVFTYIRYVYYKFLDMM